MGGAQNLTTYRWSTATDPKEWDDFIQHSGGTVYHSWAWKQYLEDSGSPTAYVLCRDQLGGLVAACPFAVIKKSRFVCALDSLPFSSAGPVVRSDVNSLSTVLTSLPKFNHFTAIFPTPVSMKIRVDQERIAKPMSDLGWRYAIHEGDILLDFQENNPDGIWKQNLRKDEKNEIRYFERAGNSFRLARTESDYDAFIELYKESMGRRGYSERSRKISSMRRCFGNSFKVNVLEFEGRFIAGISFLCSERESAVRLDKIGYIPVKNSRSPYLFMLWMMINWAYEMGYRYLRLGTTPADENHPLHRTKSKFGGVFIPEFDFDVPVSSRSLSSLRSIRKAALRLRRD